MSSGSASTVNFRAEKWSNEVDESQNLRLNLRQPLLCLFQGIESLTFHFASPSLWASGTRSVYAGWTHLLIDGWLSVILLGTMSPDQLCLCSLASCCGPYSRPALPSICVHLHKDRRLVFSKNTTHSHCVDHHTYRCSPVCHVASSPGLPVQALRGQSIPLQLKRPTKAQDAGRGLHVLGDQHFKLLCVD
jgi:hypothetical protein